MEDKIERIISEYERKISICDELLRIDLVKKRVARRENDLEGVESFVKSIAIKNAQRQAYVQAIVDFDSLLDELLKK